MITAVDSSVLLDVLTANAAHGPRSAAALRRASIEGALIMSTAVLAEIIGAFKDPEEPTASLDRLGLELVPDDRAVAVAAGRGHRAYRLGGGKRTRILPDFLIGAHARVHAERLLTRDRGFYRSHFQGLTVMEP